MLLLSKPFLMIAALLAAFEFPMIDHILLFQVQLKQLSDAERTNNHVAQQWLHLWSTGYYAQ